MTDFSLIALILAAGMQSDAPRPPTDPVAWISGDWAIVDTNTGETLQACVNAQRFKLSVDGRTIDLTELGGSDFHARYSVLHREEDRVLMFIEGEDRRTDDGDPVLWWAYFEGPDQFAWRRYDWPASARTQAWQRCR